MMSLNHVLPVRVARSAARKRPTLTRVPPTMQPAEMDQLREWEETLAEQVGAADPSRHSRNRA